LGKFARFHHRYGGRGLGGGASTTTPCSYEFDRVPYEVGDISWEPTGLFAGYQSDLRIEVRNKLCLVTPRLNSSNVAQEEHF